MSAIDRSKKITDESPFFPEMGEGRDLQDRHVLVINAGSSSLKFSVFKATANEVVPLHNGLIERVTSDPVFWGSNPKGEGREKVSLGPGRAGHQSCLAFLLEWLAARVKIDAAGHRVVHGGTRFSKPVLITDEIFSKLAELSPLAPLHQPHNLAAIKTLQGLYPQLPQVACFDTAFHATKPEIASIFPLPREMAESGIRRYGFHGLSYEYIARTLPGVAPELAKGRVIVLHLGSGASICALKSGVSVESSMGFTAVDGLPMGTRCGAVDPGVVLFLMRERGMSADAIENLLYNQSGLKGVSGISSDMRELLASDHPHATQAIDLFIYWIARQMGAMVATLGGVDGVVFTAGIGERSAEIRERICSSAEWMGLRVDSEANREGRARISLEGSPVSAWVIPTNEEGMIARHTLEILNGEKAW